MAAQLVLKTAVLKHFYSKESTIRQSERLGLPSGH